MHDHVPGIRNSPEIVRYLDEVETSTYYKVYYRHIIADSSV